MEYLLNLSANLEPIFYKLLYMSIIATIMGSFILLLKKLTNHIISPKWISRIWLLFILSLIIPISISTKMSIYNYIPINIEKIQEIDYSQNKIIEMQQGFDKSENTYDKNLENEKSNQEKIDIIEMIPIIWFILFCTSLMVYISTYIILEINIRRQTFNKDFIIEKKDLLNILKKCKMNLKIKYPVKLIVQDYVKMPSIFGVFNIRILINKNILSLSEQEIRYIFMHELAHYKRKDNLLNMVIIILKCIYFFNPLICLLMNKVKESMEISTDEIALEYEDKESKKIYCKILVNASAIDTDKFIIKSVCLSDDKKNLERRISMIKSLDKFKNKKNIIFIAVSIIILIISIFFTTSNQYVSLQDIRNLTKRVEKIKNVYIEEKTEAYIDENLENENLKNTYFKDDIFYNIIQNSANQNDYEWIDYNKNEGIYIYNDTKEIQVYTNLNGKNVEDLTQGTVWAKICINDPLRICKSIESDFINGIETYKINIIKYFMNDGKKEISDENIFWIDKQKGVVIKWELITPINNHKTVTTYKYVYDIVTDNDILKPDLSEYEEYTYI